MYYFDKYPIHKISKIFHLCYICINQIFVPNYDKKTDSSPNI